MLSRCIRRYLLTALAIVTVPALPARPDELDDRKPVVLMRADGSRYYGVVKSADQEQIVLLTGKDRQEKTVDVEELKPVSVYVAHRETMDLSKAESHFELGKLCTRLELSRNAQREFDLAERLDKSYKAKVAAFRKEFEETGGKPRMAREVSDKQVAANRKQADEWFEYVKENINAKARFSETDHFWVYSTFKPSDDKGIHRALEKLYTGLCKQFAIPPRQNIWAGKAAIFCFWEEDEYQKFTRDVMKLEKFTKASGYCGRRGNGMVFVVMGPTRNRSWFYELLTHETTHGFVARYRSNRGVPTWVNEGLAEYMASTLVPKSNASYKMKIAHAQALKNGRSVMPVFKGVGLEAFDYGAAQSLVRYLIARDRKAFIRFFNLMKVGPEDEDDDGDDRRKKRAKPLSGEEALKEAYGLTYEELAKEWRKALLKSKRR
ncbi:MAG: hypothetical protein ACLFV7_09380 [Phycisphaerae bacterium]